MTFWRFTNRIIIIIIIIITTLLREHGKSQGGHYSKSGGILQHLHRKTDIITVSTVLNTHTHTHTHLIIPVLKMGELTAQLRTPLGKLQHSKMPSSQHYTYSRGTDIGIVCQGSLATLLGLTGTQKLQKVKFSHRQNLEIENKEMKILGPCKAYSYNSHPTFSSATFLFFSIFTHSV